MCRRTVVLVCLLLSVSARMGAQESAPIDFETARFERRLTAKRTAGAIVIDGRLDEADWRNAPLATDFLQNDPREGEPASAASVAGTKLLREEGVIGANERVVCILTGHQLKDPTATFANHTTDQEQFNKILGSRGVKRAAFANRAVAVSNDLGEIIKAIQLYG